MDKRTKLIQWIEEEQHKQEKQYGIHSPLFRENQTVEDFLKYQEALCKWTFLTHMRMCLNIPEETAILWTERLLKMFAGYVPASEPDEEVLNMEEMILQKERAVKILGEAVSRYHDRWKAAEERCESLERLLIQSEQEIERLRTPASEPYREL